MCSRDNLRRFHEILDKCELANSGTWLKLSGVGDRADFAIRTEVGVRSRWISLSRGIIHYKAGGRCLVSVGGI